MFIEPSTARCYGLAKSPYLGVEAMWNHVNYWACMQMPEPHSDSRAPPQQLSLDLTDASKWEFLLPNAQLQVPPCQRRDDRAVLIRFVYVHAATSLCLSQ